MKRARGGDELCACGHVACKKLVSDLYERVQKWTEKLEKNASEKPLTEAVKECQRQILLMEELGRQQRVFLAEFYKQKIVNVTLKREIPLKKAASDTVEPPPLPKKKKRS